MKRERDKNKSERRNAKAGAEKGDGLARRTDLLDADRARDRVEQDIVEVPARLPDREAAKALVGDEVALRGCAQMPGEHGAGAAERRAHALKEAASSYETMTCVLGLYTYGVWLHSSNR